MSTAEEQPEGGVPHGQGLMVEADGERYHGEFVRGERSGAGRLRHANGDVFEGDFLAGLRHGPGKLTTAAGATFEGVWRHDGLEGDVQHTAAVGEADADGGMRRTYANGDVYRGEWEGGAPHGHRTTTRTRAALHSDCRAALHRCAAPPHCAATPHRATTALLDTPLPRRTPLPGEGVMIYASGGRYEGQWEYGRPHGASSLLYPYPYPYP